MQGHMQGEGAWGLAADGCMTGGEGACCPSPRTPPCSRPSEVRPQLYGPSVLSTQWQILGTPLHACQFESKLVLPLCHINRRLSYMFQSYLLLIICNAKLTCYMLYSNLCRLHFSTPVSFLLLFSVPSLKLLYLLSCIVTKQDNNNLSEIWPYFYTVTKSGNGDDTPNNTV